MKHLKIYSAIVLLAIGFSNCKKILDKVDINGVPDATVWATEGTATLYLNNLYNLVMPVWFSSESAATLPTSLHNTTDDYNGGTTTILTGGLTTETVTDFYTSASTSAYPYIRKINTLFDGVEGSSTLTADVKAKLEAQAYFLRAYVYFQLVKLYGGVPYITSTQNYLTDSLNVPRNSTSQCIAMMISDLNHCSVLPAKWASTADFGRITRGAALALKARILLYWASPQFNPNNDITRWQTALQANQNAYDTLKMDGYALYSNFYRIALDINNATDKEPILFRSYNGSTTISGLTNNYDNITRPYSQSAGSGGATNNPTWNLVQAFWMKDGKSITDPTSAYKYDSVNYWKNRDPRFNQTIAYNGGYWGLSGASGRKQWSYTGITDDKTKPTTTGFYCRKNIDTTITAINTTYGKCAWVEMRLAEVYLNLAECANATGNQTLAIALIDSIRARAGVDKGTNGMYGLTTGLTTAQLASIILNERRVEFAFEGKRYDDLRRTRTFDALNGTYRNQLAIAPKSPYTVATLEKVLPGGGLARDTINVDVEFTKYFTTTVKPLTNESPINFPTLYYFYAIPSSNLGKDPNLFQTAGWGTQNGVFDPLQ